MEKVVIGKIINTFGLKGEVKIASSTDFPEERFQVGAHLFIHQKSGDLEMEIATHRVHKGYDLISFVDHQDINLIEKYKESDCLAYKDESLLDEGEYYVNDMIGCLVYNSGELLGAVKDVMDNTYQDILVVDYKHKKVLIPYVDAFVEKTDVENKRIDVHLIEGFLDDED